MKCKNCGNEISKDDLFCPYCGEKVTVSSDLVICPECGAENEKGSKFCMSCGHAISGSKPKKTNKEKVVVEEVVKKLPKEEIVEQIPQEEVIKEAPRKEKEIGDTTKIQPVFDDEKRKSPVVLIVIICVVVLLAAGAVTYFAFFRNPAPTNNLPIPSKEQTEVVKKEDVTVEDSKKEEETPIKEEEHKEEKVEEKTNDCYELKALDNVRVRTSSTTKSDQVGKIAKGSTIYAFDIHHGDDDLTWYCINDGEWVANDGSFFDVKETTVKGDIELLSGSKGKINITKNTSVYKEPSKDSEKTGYLTESTKMLYYDKTKNDEGTWLKISCNGYVLLDNAEYYYE